MLSSTIILDLSIISLLSDKLVNLINRLGMEKSVQLDGSNMIVELNTRKSDLFEALVIYLAT